MTTEQKPIATGYTFETTAEQVAADCKIKGKIVVITGGHSGVGLETARVLSEKGALVVAGARDLEKAKTALTGLKNVEILPLDLSEPSSIDRFAQQTLNISRNIDVLINNAGVMAMPLTRDKRGLEMQFATNHLGHFQLSARLWYALKATKNARIVTLSSAGHRFAGVDFEDPQFINRPYDKWKAYGQSKSANSLFAVESDRRGIDVGIRSFAVHPGRIPTTDLLRYMDDAEMTAMGLTKENGVIKSSVLMKTIPQGAATTIWAATSPQLDGMGGVYCADCNISSLVPDDSTDTAGVRGWAVDPDKAQTLWNLSENLLKR